MKYLPALLTCLLLTSCYTLSMSDAFNESALSVSEGVRAIEEMEVADEYRPSEEYYIGKSSSAAVLETYSMADIENEDIAAKLEYLNLLAMYLEHTGARLPRTQRELGEFVDRSRRERERLQARVLFKGAIVGLLDTVETGAYGLPGGFVWVSEGALDLCDTEDELAALLAIQLAHVLLDHPLDSYRQRHRSEIIRTMLFEPELAGEGIATNYGHLIGSLAEDVMQKAYDEDLSLEADRYACWILLQAGYDPKAMLDLFDSLAGVQVATMPVTPWLHHQAPLQDRATQIVSLIEEEGMQTAETYSQKAAVRQARFEQAMGR